MGVTQPVPQGGMPHTMDRLGNWLAQRTVNPPRKACRFESYPIHPETGKRGHQNNPHCTEGPTALIACGRGEMVYAGDLKSFGFMTLGVRLPPPVLPFI